MPPFRKNPQPDFAIGLGKSFADYFDLDSVFDFYAKLGLIVQPHIIEQVKELCGIEIQTFGGDIFNLTFGNCAIVLLPFHGHGLPPTLGKIPAVDLADLVTQPAGDPRDIGAGRCSVIQFFFQ